MSQYKFASVSELVHAVHRDPAFRTKLEQAPLQTLEQVASALTNDRWVYRIVVIGLALTLLTTVGGSITLTLVEHDIPDVLVALGSGALGSLAGLLAPSPTRQ